MNTMTTLVVGGSGATGKHVINHLLNAGQQVKAIVRSTSSIPDHWNNHNQLTLINGNIAEIPLDQLSEYLADCQAVVSCLGHNMTWKGIYGKPRNLVTLSVERLCEAIQKNKPPMPVKFILMNTTGNRNRNLNEPISWGERLVISLLRVLLPPHPDNEKAADYLRSKVGINNLHIEWVAVRPDTLINEDTVSHYSLHPSPTRSALFNPGQTSRINVGHFMASLVMDDEMWDKWKGQMPVIYNETNTGKLSPKKRSNTKDLIGPDIK